MNRYMPWIVRGLLMAGLLVAALILRRYDFARLDESAGIALATAVRGGAFLILRPVDGDTPLGAGSLVEAYAVIPEELATGLPQREGLIYSRIAAAPGSILSFEERSGGEYEILVDGRRTFANFTPRAPLRDDSGRALREGPVPDGFFLLLNPNLLAPAWDSRRLGLFHRSDLRRRILSYF